MLDRQKQIEELLESMNVLKRVFTTHRDDYLKKSGLTYSQALVLHIIIEHDGVGIKDIAQRLGVTSSAATQLVDILVKKGYLVRQESQQDRRALQIRLSEDGRKRIRAFKTRVLERLFDAIDDEELVQYCELNRKIIGNILDRTGKG